MCAKVHPLPSEWEFWVVQSNQNYEIESIATFNTIESFWNVYSQFPSIEKMENGGLSLFKRGIKPAWEDESNLNGFSIRIKKKFEKKEFDELVMMIIGGSLEQKMPDVQLCGLYVLKKTVDNMNVALWFKEGEISTESLEAFLQMLRVELKHVSVKNHPSNP